MWERFVLGNLGNKEVKFMNHSIFDDVNHALVWATEPLKGRRVQGCDPY